MNKKKETQWYFCKMQNSQVNISFVKKHELITEHDSQKIICCTFITHAHQTMEPCPVPMNEYSSGWPSACTALLPEELT